VLRERLRTTLITLAELNAGLLYRAGQPRAFEHRPCGREHDANRTMTDALERFDPFARHFGVRLGLAEPFARRIQGDRRIATQRLEIRQPAFRFRQALGHDGDESARQATREGGDEHGVAGSGESADPLASRGRRQGVDQARERTEVLDRVEQKR
jgi:hypothetical protein